MNCFCYVSSFCPYSFYESTKFDENIDELTNRICLNFCHEKPFYQDNEIKKIIVQLARDFLKCFRYELPPFHKIDVDQYKTNYTSVVDDEKELKFHKKYGKKLCVKFEKQNSNNEINFQQEIISQSDSEIDIQIKKKYYQTKAEIHSIYPSLKENVDSLFFYNYMEHIKKIMDKAADIENKRFKHYRFISQF